MFVKAEKPNHCYKYFNLIENLKKVPASDMALALKCKDNNLGCETAYELIFSH